MTRLFSRLGPAVWLLLAIGFGQGSSRCNSYEGRSLDLFPASVDLALECQASKDCPRDRSYCARGSCVQCLLDADCDRRHPACVGNACVECRSAEDCGLGQGCNNVLEACAPACSIESDCAGRNAPRCSRELAVCVQCVSDTDCKEPRSAVCGRGGRCVSCRDESDCPLDAGPPAPDAMRGPMPMGPMPEPMGPMPEPAPAPPP
jgi:hypothetical protein